MPHPISLSRLAVLLNRPLFGTIAVPRNARVDPTGFPEDEFPVHCPGCGYELRGLPEQRCPECGQAFDRGRLIVLQYAEGLTRRPIAARDLRLLLWLGLGTLVIMGLGYMGPYIVMQWTPGAGTPASAQGLLAPVERLAWFWRITSTLQVLAVLALCAVVLRIVHQFCRSSARRRRVREAIHSHASASPN